jgi:NAD(P)H dehydrogenase (quinone)
MLRNSIYMETRLPVAERMIRTGRAEVPSTDIVIAYVAREDCAASAAAALATPGHDGRAYPITGPYRVDTRTVAEIAAAVTGKPIRIERAPPAATGRPPPYGGSSVAIVSDAVAELTGRPATSLKTFFGRHRAELLGERAA